MKKLSKRYIVLVFVVIFSLSSLGCKSCSNNDSTEEAAPSSDMKHVPDYPYGGEG